MNKPNSSTTKAATKKNYTKVDSFSVDRVKSFDNGGVVADLTINGIRIYGVNVVEGKDGDFLSFPQRKGKDGKYYSIVWVALSPEDSKDILSEIEKAFND